MGGKMWALGVQPEVEDSLGPPGIKTRSGEQPQVCRCDKVSSDRIQFNKVIAILDLVTADELIIESNCGD